MVFKMESNSAKLKAEAETGILQWMEKEEALHNELQEKKHQYLLAEKNRLLHELLDLQVRNCLICRPFVHLNNIVVYFNAKLSYQINVF